MFFAGLELYGRSNDMARAVESYEAKWLPMMAAGYAEVILQKRSSS
jgi:hypothetical protein